MFKLLLSFVYCINHLLESATPFFLILLLDKFSYQLPISDPSFPVVINISNSSKLLLLAHRVSYEVVLSSLYMRH